MKLILNIPDHLYEKHLKGFSQEELEDWIKQAIFQKIDTADQIKSGIPSEN